MSGVPWYHVEWCGHLGGKTWEPVKNLTGEDGVITVQLFDEEREREAAKHLLRVKVRVLFYMYILYIVILYKVN
jgi:hypothetical protein